MRADNTHHLITAAKQRHELTRAKAVRALRDLDNAGAAITFESVAKTAGISRSWLYQQTDLRAEIERLREHTRRTTGRPITVPARQNTSDPSLQTRLEIANQRNRDLTDDNQRLRRQLAHALGQLRTAGQRPEPES